MSGTTPALIAAAAGVGFGHAILPDHWAPLAVVGRTHRYSLSRVARLSGLAGVAHVLVSIILGAVLIAVGLQFRHAVESAQNLLIGSVLVLTGIGFVILELTGRGQGHSHEHEHGHEHGRSHEHGHPAEHPRPHGHEQVPGARGVAAIMVPFGAAASPDLTILPVFLAASAGGVFAAVGALVVFATVTIATIVGLTMVACFGGYQLPGKWLARWGNALTAAVLVTIGGLVVAGIL